MESSPTVRAEGGITSALATGWTISGSGGTASVYTFNPGAAERYYNDATFVDASSSGGASGTMSGPNFTGVFGVGVPRSISQTLATTLAANTAYTLTVSLGHRTVDSGAAATASPVTLELLAGGSVIATATVNPSAGIWSDAGALPDDLWADAVATGATGASHAQLGQPLTIRFTKGASGDYMDLDNVRLEATPVTALLADGMIGYFPFESDFANEAGRMDGYGRNGALAGRAGGRVGNAMELRSAGGSANEHFSLGIGYGAANGSSSNLGQSFTISAWYQLDSPPAGSGSGRYFVFEGETEADVSYGIRNSSLGTAGINDGQVYTGNGTNFTIADAAIAGWHHLVQTFTINGTNTEIRTWIDGAPQSTVLNTPTSGLADTGMNFGAARNTVTDRGFDGKIDEVALWKRVLTPEEIAEVRALGLAGSALPKPPRIASFATSKTAAKVGETVTLHWNVTGATSVSIEPAIGVVPSVGSMNVTVTSPVTYTLTATGDGGVTSNEQVNLILDRGPTRVFLLGGQSNMQGVGRKSALVPRGLASIPEILLYHSNAVSSTGGPNNLISVRACGFDSNTFGPEIGFAQVMRDIFPGQSICLLKHAYGGTSLQMRWKPGASVSDTANFGPDYTTFVSTVNAGMAALRAQGYQPMIEGMLWMQGEQDSKEGLNTGGDGNSTSADDYGVNLKHFVSRVREQFAADIAPSGMRFVLGQVLPYAPNGGEVSVANPGRDKVRQAQLNAAEDSGAPLSISNTATVPTDSLNYPVHEQVIDGFRDTDEVHLDETAQLNLGRAMAYKMIGMAPQSYSQWATDHLLEGDADEDDDQDGLKNLVEFALGSDPRNPTNRRGAEISKEIVNGVPEWVLRFPCNRNAQDAVLSVKLSEDLQTWLDTAVFLDSSSSSGDTSWLRYYLPWPANDTARDRGFLKLEATRSN